MEKEMNAGEAVYGLMAWLTTREETVCFGGSENCAPAAELAEQFCKTNSLPVVTKDWPHNLIHPKS